jgi:hypothetical protein
VTQSGLEFDPGVEASSGIWPAPPELWSYSSLKEVAACPRRWMLTRAKYPALWARAGYPPLPVRAALFGDVVHEALETIVKALVAAGCESPRAAEAVQVLRELGGITAVAEQALDKRLARLDDNPRLSGDRRKRLEVELRDRLPDARTQIQGYLARTDLPAAGQPSGPATCANGSAGPRSVEPRQPVGVGAHPEVTLTAEALRLTGRVDLLTVAGDAVRITDYKTGAEDPNHLDQLHAYALLWDQDRDVNPSGRKATTLTAAYPGHEVTVPAPAEDQLQALREAYEARIASAEAEIFTPMPTAVTGPENCGFCPVRQLCREYWEEVAPAPATLSPGAWFDYQGVVGQQNGPRSWWMMSRRTKRRELLMRTTSPLTTLPTGLQIRVLGVRLDDDPEVDALVGAMSASSEVFIVTDRSASLP